MKSGRDEQGRKRNIATENVHIKGCTVYAAHGGFVIGSEMSGGVKNVYVSNCTFIGTDIGLRFKSTRGRGGVVENIFVDNIYMKDIVGEAILFDMYYAAKDPVPIAGEQKELPKVEFLPINETTPIFKNFTISNVYCNGAEKAIFIRGIPEMPVKNIIFQNMVLQANAGIDIQEANNITFNNIQCFALNNNPLVDVTQSSNIYFNQLKFNKNINSLFRVNGERSNNIHILKTDTANAKQPFTFELGASSNSIVQ